jgi:CRISPR/Cas system-associated exonuclease Cas4 (RecB family)
MVTNRKWAIQFEEYKRLFEIVNQQPTSDSLLRFDRRFVIASDIGSQYYCEKKVELQYVHGKIETEAKTIGTQAHEKLTEDGVKIKHKDLFKKIYSKKPVLALEMFLLGKYKNVMLAGVADSILFKNGFPLIVYEYKFSRNGTAYPSYYAQVDTYNILLESMGFDTSKLYSAIIVADPITRGDRALRLEVLLKTQTSLNQSQPQWLIPAKNATIYFKKYSKTQAEKTLDWAIEFWTKSREPQTCDNPNKCNKCEYQEHCLR